MLGCMPKTTLRAAAMENVTCTSCSQRQPGTVAWVTWVTHEPSLMCHRHAVTRWAKFSIPREGFRISLPLSVFFCKNVSNIFRSDKSWTATILICTHITFLVLSTHMYVKYCLWMKAHEENIHKIKVMGIYLNLSDSHAAVPWFRAVVYNLLYWLSHQPVPPFFKPKRKC